MATRSTVSAELPKRLRTKLGPALRALRRLSRRRTLSQEDCCEFWKTYGPVIKVLIKAICPRIGPRACETLSKLAQVLDSCCKGARRTPSGRRPRRRAAARPRRTARKRG